MQHSPTLAEAHIDAHHDRGRCLIDGPECPYLEGRWLSLTPGGSPAERKFDELAARSNALARITSRRCDCRDCRTADALLEVLTGLEPSPIDLATRRGRLALDALAIDIAGAILDA